MPLHASVVEVQDVGLFLSKFWSSQAKVLREIKPNDMFFHNSVADVCTVLLLGFMAKGLEDCA